MFDSNKYYARTDTGDHDFWDLSKNKGTAKPSQSYPIHKKTSTESVLIESGADDKKTDVSFKIPEKKVGFSTPDTILEYTPENIFINKVKITTTDKEKNIFNPSALFIRERAALLNKKGVPCDYVSFYAHSPRYSGMTRPQLNYYLWWRENVRRGEFIKTDISYIKLYIQEIVTADNDTDVKKSLSDLIQIAKVSFDNPVGKVYMARIISDFCMIHKLECPTPELFDILKSLVFEHIADEFFLGLTDSNRHVYAPIAIDYISIYNYKKSKFYESDNIAIFDRHIHAAIHSIFANDESFGEITSHASGIFSTKLSDRKLFDGRVEFCAPNARILVSYFPVNCIAGVVTDAIRYAENKLRALMGIKTSLAVGELSPKITSVIDEYFSSVSFEFTTYKTASKEKAEKRSEEQYNHLYDIPRHKLSLSNARVIEQTSWQTTKKLTEAFTDNENIVGAIHESPAKPAECQAQNADVSAECRMQSAELNISAECRVQSAELQLNEDSSLGQKSTSTLHSKWGSHHAFLLICLNGTHAEQRNYAKSFGMTLDELADNINDIAVNLIGDIILDFDGDKYTVIPDYIDVIEEKNI